MFYKSRDDRQWDLSEQKRDWCEAVALARRNGEIRGWSPEKLACKRCLYNLGHADLANVRKRIDDALKLMDRFLKEGKKPFAEELRIAMVKADQKIREPNIRGESLSFRL